MVIFLHSDPNIGKSKDIMLGRLARAECLRIIPSCQLGSSIRMYSTVSNDEMGGSIILRNLERGLTRYEVNLCNLSEVN
jgi:hypothetical protein